MNLALTFDYELFGDGSGDVIQHMIEPTEAILGICEQHGIKTTIFFEVLEYLKIKEEWGKGNSMGYKRNPVQAIEKQVQQAALSGHDIQLHLHPQWVQAEWTGTHWELDMDNWRLGDFSAEGWTIEKLLRESKQALEELVRQAVPDYECTILRAGAFNIMPSEAVWQAMKNVGLKADSSVYPGGYKSGSLSRYDYCSVSEEKDYWWGAEEDLRKKGDTKEIMEIPVFALPQRRIHKVLNVDKIKSILTGKRRKISSVAAENLSSRGLFGKLTYLFGREAFTWDFCLFSNYLHKSYFRYIENNLSDKRKAFVIIGHPKSYRSDRSLETLIHLAHKKDYQFMTLKEVYENFSD